MPAISQLHFKTAIVLLIVGIGIGISMSMSGNHSVIGAHAHLNLLGWVTGALYGAYLALSPVKAAGQLPRVQYGVHVLGVVLMTGSLYFYLQGNSALEPLVAISSIIVAIGVLMFAFIIFKRD